MTETLLSLRAIWRLTRVAVHLAAGLAIVWLAYPFISRRGRLAIKQRWSRQLLELLCVELIINGASVAAMRVANHVSWLDIFAFNAASPAAFIAKDDVRRWPLIGWLCARTDTLFIRRGSPRAAHEMSCELAARLAEGAEVVAFPEGTTSDGQQVLPFHGALLQGAIAAGVPIQPVALAYQTRDGRSAQAPVYCGDTSLLQSMWRIASASGLAVRLKFLPVRDTTDRNRRELAMQLRSDIVAVMAEPGALSRPGAAA